MRGLVSVIETNSSVVDALDAATKIIAPNPAYPFLLAERAKHAPLLVITSSSRGAEDLAHELRELHARVLEFPAWETLPHERLSPRSDTVAKRIQTLSALQSSPQESNPIVVAPIRAVIHRFIASLATEPLMTIELGQEVSLTDLIRHFADL